MAIESDSINTRCCVCGGTSATIVYPKDVVSTAKPAAAYSPVAQDLGIYHDLVRCDGCGMHYSRVQESATELLGLYVEAQDTTGAYMAVVEERRVNSCRAYSIARRFLPSNIPVQVLDVGAGSGIFVGELQRRKVDVIGVEPSRGLVEQAKRRFGVSLFCGTLEEAKLSSDHYDLVAMFDVIEHLANPHGLVDEAARLLKPGGVLVLLTPNINSLSARLIGRKWWSFRQMHVQYFCPKTLARLVSQHRLTILLQCSFWKTFPVSHYLSVALKRTIHLPRWLNFKLTLPLGDTVGVYRKDEDKPPRVSGP